MKNKGIRRNTTDKKLKALRSWEPKPQPKAPHCNLEEVRTTAYNSQK